jgi:hypothetical protein
MAVASTLVRYERWPLGGLRPRPGYGAAIGRHGCVSSPGPRALHQPLRAGGYGPSQEVSHRGRRLATRPGVRCSGPRYGAGG